ncbi:MAG: GNAT family N-acetyltransferase [Pseudomonadota bacterium]
MTDKPEGGSVEPDARASAMADVLQASFESPSQQWSARASHEILCRPGVWAEVHTDRCVVVLVAADEAEVLTIAVKPGGRRRGRGRALLQSAMRQASDLGASRLFLEVASDNKAARALYWREGFREVGRRKGYYQRPDRPVDALVLARDL